MSRLDSFIRRLSAQRDCLAEAARLIAGLPGPVLELGLGNGRTYDHLRETLPGREIFVFDRQIAAHPDCIPDTDHMMLGDFADTLSGVAARLPAPVALAHMDVGLHDPAANAAQCALVAGAVAPLMAAGGVIVADQAMTQPGWTPLALPDGVPEDRYFMYRVVGG